MELKDLKLKNVIVKGNIKSVKESNKAVHVQVAHDLYSYENGSFKKADAPQWYLISAFKDSSAAQELLKAEPGQYVELNVNVNIADVIDNFDKGFNDIPAIANKAVLGLKKGERKSA